MSLAQPIPSARDPLLDQLKIISGRRIEDARRSKHLTQKQLARLAGFSVRWIRDIETGSPSVKLDDHLQCALTLRLAPSYIFLPLLFRVHRKTLPADLAPDELADLDRRCIDLVSRRLRQRAPNP